MPNNAQKERGLQMSQDITITLAVPTVGLMHHKGVESMLSAVGSGLIQAVNVVPRLPIQQARTRLVETTKTTHILFADDDMVYGADEIAYLVENADKDIVCGLAYTRTEREPKGVVLQRRGSVFVLDQRYGYGIPVRQEVHKVDGGTLAFALIKMEVFEKVGKVFQFGDNGATGEDIDFFERCWHEGLQTYLDPRARVGHLTDRII